MSTQTLSTIHLAHTQGFCAGVSNAIEIVEICLENFGTPLYVRHQIVHNTTVIEELEARGVIFIENLDDVPDEHVVIFSAHGTAPDVFEAAKKRGLTIIDATCPLVTKVHRQATRYSSRQIPTILIGHRGHQELIGTSGYVNPKLLQVVETLEDIQHLTLDPEQEVAILTQTTLSVDDTQHLIAALKKKYPKLITGSKKDICYATQNRQDAVKELSKTCDLIIVCGSKNSSNSNRLKETAVLQGTKSYIIDKAKDFKHEWIKGIQTLGITSGASVPFKIVQELVHLIQKECPSAKVYQKESLEKGIAFPLPKNLKSINR